MTTTTRAQYTRIDNAASLVWDALEDAGAQGLDLEQLTIETGLNRNQVRRGIHRLKRVIQVGEEQPIACVMPGYRYVLTEHWQEERDYILNRLRDLHSRLEGIEPTIEAAALKWGRTGTRRILARQTTRVREDVADLLAAAAEE